MPSLFLGVIFFVGACQGGRGQQRSQAAEAEAPTAQLLNAGSRPQDWLMHGGTYAEQRFSALDQIGADNVSDLGLGWSLELDTNRGQETTPLVLDGRIYLTTAWSKVVAIDGASGRKLWQFDPKVPGDTAVRGCCDVVNRGAAYYDGKIYVGTFDGRLIALSASDGRQLWSVNTVDQGRPYSITGAPRIVKGKVIIGNAGAELGVRGYVSAYDAQTGKPVWRFYTVPNAQGKADGAASDEALRKLASGTWFDGEWKNTGGGGTVWDAIVYDTELDQLYIGVGNGTPWNHKIRSGGKGDNLFLSSIVALDPDSGKYLWHSQETPAETWDFTATQPIILATLTIDGRPRKVLMQAPKNGFFYVLDRTDGKLISARPFSRVNWANGVDPATGRPREVPGARYEKAPFLMSPSAYGAHNWYPMAFSPKTGLVYLPVQDVPFYYQQDSGYRYRSQTFNLGTYSEKNALPDSEAARKTIGASLKGALIAWDPVRQKEVWRAEQPGPAAAGVLATAGGLVFEGNPTGAFEAFDAQSGKRLWKFQAETQVVGSPMSYAVKGQQYILVVSGAGGGYGLTSPFTIDKRPKPNGRVLAFRLGGKDSLNAYQAPALSPAVIPAESFTAAEVGRGERIYETTCGWCHGPGGVSGGVLPDLRRSPALADDASWNAVLLEGLLQDRGMVTFSKTLTRQDATDVRAYLASKARLLHGQESAK
ncbi:PQQ-dependent dehydrogenase, methanol/ethanol family [Sphingobium sp. 15-1]|uniref:PQQ-dependent dehydrogenase, methanol/ethanol family n=1 Tax=Sphingobium sp. 15-1 TaxID=2729616 RepID=UPI00159BFBEB|nr:PQQ-dependent dehydrogenase, methanol/ethanol family [Sphingobium sp. 15-1]